MYVIGLIETQFFAYMQLIRYRLGLINKILAKMSSDNKTNSIHRIPILAKMIQLKPNSFEYLASKARCNNMFKSPSVICSRFAIFRKIEDVVHSLDISYNRCEYYAIKSSNLIPFSVDSMWFLWEIQPQKSNTWVMNTMSHKFSIFSPN